MKKVALTLASVMAAAAFAPEASAIPSFARQTGMACSACHQQHYPVLNGFGQAFKAAGYTMMGAQEKVEGEHLSIPGVLNASMLLKARYQQTNGNAAASDKADNTGKAVAGSSTNSGQWQIPDEFSLFLGGRVGDNGALKMGFMFEGNTAAAGALVAGFKMPVVIDTDSVKFLVIPYMTDALGTSYGFEQSSTGAVRGVRWAEHRKEISAQQYIGTDGAATGIAFVGVHEMGYINVSRWSPNFTASAGTGAVAFTSNYIRAAVTPTVAGWAINAGVQSWSGENHTEASGAYTLVKNEATAVDFQAFGQVGGNDLGVYATYATAPKTSGTIANGFNGGAFDKTAMTVGADYSVIPHTLHLGAAYRSATNNANKSDNAITLMAIYDLTQNVVLQINTSTYSGDAYNGTPANGTALTTFLLEAAW